MKCFLILDNNDAVEVDNILYNRNKKTAICNDVVSGDRIEVDAEKVIIIDNEDEMKIFREEHTILW